MIRRRPASADDVVRTLKLATTSILSVAIGVLGMPLIYEAGQVFHAVARVPTGRWGPLEPLAAIWFLITVGLAAASLSLALRFRPLIAGLVTPYFCTAAGWLNAVLCYGVLSLAGHGREGLVEVIGAAIFLGGGAGLLVGVVCSVPVALCRHLMRSPTHSSVELALCGLGVVVCGSGVLFRWIVSTHQGSSYSVSGAYLGGDALGSSFTVSPGYVTILAGLAVITLALVHLHQRFKWLDGVSRGHVTGWHIVELAGEAPEGILPFFGFTRDRPDRLLVQEAGAPPSGIYRSSQTLVPWGLLSPAPVAKDE